MDYWQFMFNHMTSDISKFDKLEEYQDGTIKNGNDVPCLVKVVDN